jgi:hypothetical protein
MDVQDAVHEANLVADGQSNAIKDITFGSASRTSLSEAIEMPLNLTISALHRLLVWLQNCLSILSI